MLHQQQQIHFSALTNQIDENIKKIKFEVKNLRSISYRLEKQGGIYQGTSGTVLAYLEAVMRIIGLPISMIGGGVATRQIFKGRKTKKIFNRKEKPTIKGGWK